MKLLYCCIAARGRADTASQLHSSKVGEGKPSAEMDYSKLSFSQLTRLKMESETKLKQLEAERTRTRSEGKEVSV